MNDNTILLQGDCLEVLKELPDNSVDSLVTDPPAGISFMGKEWDEDKGGSKQWIAWMSSVMKECLRVLKPGAHGFVWAIPRTSHWTATALEDAGFEIRDVVMHIFGSGFPKSLDISKAIDKAVGAERKVIGKSYIRGSGSSKVFDNAGPGLHSDTVITAPATPEAKLWQGWGTALKPASEHWILVRKPISEKTVAANVLKHGTGGINIDASRIAGGLLDSDKRMTKGAIPNGAVNYGGGMPIGGHEESVRHNPIRRFPANLVLSHNPDCGACSTCNGVGLIEEEVEKGLVDEICCEDCKGIGFVDLEHANKSCVPGCAVAMLDQQSGVLKSGEIKPYKNNGGWKQTSEFKTGSFEPSSGGASRFFYCAKASKRERNEGCDGLPEGLGKRNFSSGMEYKLQADGSKTSIAQVPESNTHPTVKPLKLMQYLITMITPPNGIVLDPFMGSGSTGVAAIESGFQFIGIEKEQEYFTIAEARINKGDKDNESKAS